MNTTPILPPGWNPKDAGDRVLAGLRNVCAPRMKGAHDSDFVFVDGKAYIVYMANDVRLGEQPDWPFVYDALSVVDLETGAIEPAVTFAASEMRYDNETLPAGACFLTRIIVRDDRALRCFFVSEDPGRRPSQAWRIDYDLGRRAFDRNIFRVEIETCEGIFPMQPQHAHRHAVARGFVGDTPTSGLYIHSAFKEFDGRRYVALNRFPTGPSFWAELNPDMTRLKLLGVLHGPASAWISESSVNRLPDGTWLAISRQENGDQNYLFSSSRDGIEWTPHAARPPVINGTFSKPTFDRFGELYYLGWNEATRINGTARSVFNLEVSRDGLHWERKYRFETDRSFQYPCFKEYRGAVYVSVTQGDPAPDHHSGKQRILFGRLE